MLSSAFKCRRKARNLPTANKEFLLLYVLLDDLPNLLIESKELLNVAFPSSNVFICD